jgi:uncharacterized tellurite resistance protein B-like protein
MTEINVSAHLKGQFLRLYQMAASDGEFSSVELEMLYNYALSRGVSKEDLTRILGSPLGKIAVPTSLEQKVEYLYDLAKMVWADGIVNDDEIDTMRKYAKRFGFEEGNINDIVDYILQSVNDDKSLNDILNEITNG